MSIYRDLALDIGLHPATFDVLKKVDVNAVKESMKNILFNAPFDIPFEPHAGANLRNLLFSTLNVATIATIKNNILSALNDLEPRVVINDLYVAQDGSNGVAIGILFTVIGNPTQQTLNFSFNKTR